MEFDLLEWILMIALIVALFCSLVISWRVYIMKDSHYKRGFSTWQMPMIFAILADLYLIR
jgi:Na+-transporting NADH:ubiquinone oxidoreductase subunit NqrC